MSQIVRAVWAGRLHYKAGLELQSILANFHHVKSFKNKNSIIFCEHHPVYTIGIRDKLYSDKEKSKLIKLGADFVQTNRGGLLTFHGPGQLIAYPIINLRSFNKTIRCYVKSIENMVVQLCANFGIKASTTKDTGIWVEDRKICAIGIHASRYITTHGLALNCNTDLKWFEHIIPCGLEGKTVTSLSKEIGSNVMIQDALPVMKCVFQDEFKCVIEDFPDKVKFELLHSLRNITDKNSC